MGRYERQRRAIGLVWLGSTLSLTSLFAEEAKTRGGVGDGIVVTAQDFQHAYPTASTPRPGPKTGFTGSKALGTATQSGANGPSNYDLAASALEDEVRAGTLPREAVKDILRRIGPVLDRIDEVGDDVDKIRAVLGSTSEGDLKVVLRVNNALSSGGTTSALPVIPNPAPAEPVAPPPVYAGTNVISAPAPLSVPTSQVMQEFEGLLQGAGANAPAKRAVKSVNGGTGAFGSPDGVSVSGTSGGGTGSFDGGGGPLGELASNTPKQSRMARFIKKIVSIFSGAPSNSVGEGRNEIAELSEPVHGGDRTPAGESALKTPRLRLGSESDLRAFSAAFKPKEANLASPSVDWIGWLFGTALLGLFVRLIWLWKKRADLKSPQI